MGLRVDEDQMLKHARAIMRMKRLHLLIWDAQMLSWNVREMPKVGIGEKRIGRMCLRRFVE
jgi:hypothetical protein